jgi:N-acetylmuramoyl-L-alanine amidase
MAGGADPAIARLRDPEAAVSCHYVIGRRGTLTALVPEERRAWHAGAGSWGGCQDVNSRSIGIELSNEGDAPFPAPQMERLEALLSDILARRAIPPQNVIGHSDGAPGRKIDPGPRFDWRRLALRGLSIWPVEGVRAVDAARFAGDLRRAGWTAEVPVETLLSSLRMRFRPWGVGPLDERDCAIAAELAARFPVDPVPTTA